MLRRLKTVPKMSLASFCARLLARAAAACCCCASGLAPPATAPVPPAPMMLLPVPLPGAVGGGAACEGGSHFLV